MKKQALVVLALVVLGGLAYFVWSERFSPKARAIERVRQALNDPDSARFEQVHYVKRTGATCGGVNAKNRMGGYVGTTAFIVGADGTVTFAPTANPEVGPTEARIKALQDQLAFLEKMAVCDVEPGDA